MRILQLLGWMGALSACGAAPCPPAAVAVHAGAEVEPIVVPDATTPGRPIEPRVLVDAPHLKLVAIVLRGGTELPVHTAPVPVTIQAVSGSGIVRVDDADYPLDPTHLVALAPEVAHSVVPAPGTDLVLLVHHVRTPGGAR